MRVEGDEDSAASWDTPDYNPGTLLLDKVAVWLPSLSQTVLIGSFVLFNQTGGDPTPRLGCIVPKADSTPPEPNWLRVRLCAVLPPISELSPSDQYAIPNLHHNLDNTVNRQNQLTEVYLSDVYLDLQNDMVDDIAFVFCPFSMQRMSHLSFHGISNCFFMRFSRDRHGQLQRCEVQHPYHSLFDDNLRNIDYHRLVFFSLFQHIIPELCSAMRSKTKALASIALMTRQLPVADYVWGYLVRRLQTVSPSIEKHRVSLTPIVSILEYGMRYYKGYVRLDPDGERYGRDVISLSSAEEIEAFKTVRLRLEILILNL